MLNILHKPLSRRFQRLTLFLAAAVPVLFLAIIFSLANLVPGSDNSAAASIELVPRPAEIIEKEASIVFVGDVMLSRAVDRAITRNNDINFPFLKLSEYINSSDLGFANLETPITAGREIVNLEMVFRSDPGVERAMKNSGFGMVSLANNHTGNFGPSGLKNTFKYLRDAGIQYVGAGENSNEANQPVYFEKNGIKFAFLAYVDPAFTPYEYEAAANRAGVAFARASLMIDAVKEAKASSDFVIVSMHAGEEYKSLPNSSQKAFARAAIDAGADLVIGHHPHVIQTLEKYKDKYIFYSLGNFVFDQMFSDAVREGLVVKATFAKNAIISIELLPTWSEALGQPRIADKDKYHLVLDRLHYDIAKDRILNIYKN